MIKYFDVHAHIASEEDVYKDLDKVLKRAFDSGVIKVVDSGYDIQSSKQALALSERYENVLATCGLQPELLIPGSDVYNEKLNIQEELDKLKDLYSANENKFVAIGECGLDYYWLNNGSISCSEVKEIKAKQKELFKSQIELAMESNAPLVVHSRGAEEECLSIINLLFYAKASKSKQRISMKSPKVLFHSYTGDMATAKKVFKKGYYISFNGILTYSKAEEIRELFRFAWETHSDLVLSETDSPFLAPSQSGSKVCEPAFIRYTVGKMADIVGEKKEKISKRLIQNAQTFYSL